MSTHDRALGTLREMGYRLTPQRMLILAAVAEGDGHMGVDEVHRRAKEAYPYVDIATIYRTLHLLKKLGVVTEVAIGDRLHYELTDPAGKHHHMVCRRCHGLSISAPTTWRSSIPHWCPNSASNPTWSILPSPASAPPAKKRTQHRTRSEEPPQRANPLMMKGPLTWARFLLALLSLALLGCGGSAQPQLTTADQPTMQLKVVSTVSPITSLVENIGGNAIELRGIVPEGVNSHTFEPAPSVAKVLAEADLIVLNGLFLEEPLLQLAEASKRAEAIILTLGDKAITHEEWVFDFSFPQADGHPNPHLWTNPSCP